MTDAQLTEIIGILNLLTQRVLKLERLTQQSYTIQKNFILPHDEITAHHIQQHKEKEDAEENLTG